MSRSQVPWLLKLLYNHNPFYLISAGLSVYGLKMFFKPFEVEYIEPWNLMGALSALTLLMAFTAYCIVKFGRVWEDARSIVLVLLLMFFAISVSFDEIVTLVSWEANTAVDALALMGFGLLLSVSVTEALLSGLKIRLPWSYRLPFYGLLALFFGFPLWVSPEVSGCAPAMATYRVALFPSFAGLITLGLLPAVRSGRGAVVENGTPWKWPCFPWCLFVFMGLAVCLRSYSLAISFDRANARAHFWDTSFGMYFLVPFLGAVLLVLLELGLVERIRKLQDGVLLAAPLLVAMSRPWLENRSWHYSRNLFLQDVISTIGSPVAIAMCGLMVFYGYAWLRGVRRAELGFIAASMMNLFVGPQSLSLSTHMQQYWPLVGLGIVELAYGLIFRQSPRTLLGAGSLTLGGTWLGVQAGLTPAEPFVIWHALLFGVIAITTLYRDFWAITLRPVAGVLLGLASLMVLASETHFGLTGLLFAAYVAVMILMATVLGLMLRERWYLIAGGSTAAASVAAVGWQFCVRLYEIDGGIPLAAAGFCFVTAVLISILKAGRSQNENSEPAVQRLGHLDE